MPLQPLLHGQSDKLKMRSYRVSKSVCESLGHFFYKLWNIETSRRKPSFISRPFLSFLFSSLTCFCFIFNLFPFFFIWSFLISALLRTFNTRFYLFYIANELPFSLSSILSTFFFLCVGPYPQGLGCRAPPSVVPIPLPAFVAAI